MLEGRSYRLQHPWVGIVNRSQADINKNVDMIAARRKEQEYFANSPDYGHLAHKMGSEYLAKLLSKVAIHVSFFGFFFFFSFRLENFKIQITEKLLNDFFCLASGECNQSTNTKYSSFN